MELKRDWDFLALSQTFSEVEKMDTTLDIVLIWRGFLSIMGFDVHLGRSTSSSIDDDVQTLPAGFVCLWLGPGTR